MITATDVRDVATGLPRTEEHLIREYLKFRVGKIVYASVSPDDTVVGFGYQRFHWVDARMAALERDELREFIVDAWRMVVPKKVAAAYDVTVRR